MNIENIVSSFSAKGLVLGNMWGDGKGTYTSTKIEAPTLLELEEKINQSLADGTLDSGGGFNGLIAVVMVVTETKSIEIEGEVYKNSKEETSIFGEVSPEEEDFLWESWESNY